MLWQQSRPLSTLAEHWSQHPPTSLKSGISAVRDVNAVSELLEQTNLRRHFDRSRCRSRTCWSGDAASAKYAPTVYYDTWRLSDPGQQWAPVAAAWLRLTEISIPSAARQEIAFLVLAEQPGRHGEGNFVAQHFNSCPKWEPGQICEFPDLLEHLAERRPRARRDRLRLCASRPCGSRTCSASQRAELSWHSGAHWSSRPFARSS